MRTNVTGYWQIFVGTIFVVAAFMKAYDARSIGNVLAFAGLKGTVFTIALFVIIGLEAAVGIALLMPNSSRWAVGACVAMLSVFTIFLIWLIRQPASPPCGCFGVRLAGSARQDQILSVLRNLLFLVTGAACWYADRRGVAFAARK